MQRLSDYLGEVRGKIAGGVSSLYLLPPLTLYFVIKHTLVRTEEWEDAGGR